MVSEASSKNPNEFKYLLHGSLRGGNRYCQSGKAFLSVPLQPSEIGREDIKSALLKEIAILPSEEQLDVLEGLLSHRVAVITGGPGTGKTTLIRSITVLLNAMGKKILLGAPTGRAARRLFEVTGRKSETVHKLLRYNLATRSFDKDRDDPLDGDAVIIDEASMMDTMLMYHLINAVPMTARLILVGDIFQLPSIGPGTVLSDMISSDRIETFELTEIFRQADESPIVNNAHRIRNGQYPELIPCEGRRPISGFYFIEQDKPDEAVAIIIDLCREHLTESLAAAPVQEIQVITPMHKGAAGTLNLNQVLQKVMNPVKRGSPSGKGRFKIHDKVMHLKNNYQKEVFNGDIGTIHEIDGENRKVYVAFDDRIVEYEEEELDELSLAYAISVHKSQGSEYPVVIVPLLTQHFVMLQRNLLYTAITRGQRLVILIGSRKALEIALKNDKPQQRMSLLAERMV